MLSTVLVVLLAFWLLGVGTSYTLGGLIHILLVIAIVVVLMRIIQGRSPLRSLVATCCVPSADGGRARLHAETAPGRSHRRLRLHHIRLWSYICGGAVALAGKRLPGPARRRGHTCDAEARERRSLSIEPSRDTLSIVLGKSVSRVRHEGAVWTSRYSALSR
jgi:hypothetical protein